MIVEIARIKQNPNSSRHYPGGISRIRRTPLHNRDQIGNGLCYSNTMKSGQKSKMKLICIPKTDKL